jgi:hypothetical protein
MRLEENLNLEELLNENGISNDDLNSGFQKLNSGKLNELTEDEVRALEFVKSLPNQIGNSVPNVQENEIRRKLDEKKKKVLEKGGKRIIHITDSHADKRGLEAIIKNALGVHGLEKLDENSILVHTGDIVGEVFETIDDFKSEKLAKKAQLEETEFQDFKGHYEIFLKGIGLSENLINQVSMNSSNSEIYGQVFRTLSSALDLEEPLKEGSVDKEEFKKAREKIIGVYRRALLNDSTQKYRDFKEVIEKYGANPNNTIVIGGNHDVLKSLETVLADYVPSPNQVKEVGGLKFVNPVVGSSGRMLAKVFTDIMGSKDISKYNFEEVRDHFQHKTKSYQTLVSRMKELDEDFNERSLELAYKIAIQKENMGENSFIVEYFNQRVFPEIDHLSMREVEEKYSDIPKGADFYIMHGSGSKEVKFRGLAEDYVHKKLSEMGGAKIIHGHIHKPNSHYNEGNLYINPGASQDGNFGTLFVNNDGDIDSFFNMIRDKKTGEYIPVLIDKKDLDEVPLNKKIWGY